MKLTNVAFTTENGSIKTKTMGNVTTVALSAFSVPVLNIAGFDDFIFHNGVCWLIHEDAEGNTVVSTVVEKDGKPTHVTAVDYDRALTSYYTTASLLETGLVFEMAADSNTPDLENDYYVPMAINGFLCFVRYD